MTTHASGARARARLSHPVVDADGHSQEFLPAIDEYLKKVGISAGGLPRAQRLPRRALRRAPPHPARRTGPDALAAGGDRRPRARGARAGDARRNDRLQREPTRGGRRRARAPELAPHAQWLDTYGLDSAYDYDPFWRRCEELGVSLATHGSGMGWGSRRSINYDPEALDRRLLDQLFARWAGDRGWTTGSPGWVMRGAGGEPADDWEALDVEREDELVDLFVPRFFFGCEADDPTTSMAFNARANPFAARLNADTNPDFFEGTAIEGEVRSLLGRRCDPSHPR